MQCLTVHPPSAPGSLHSHAWATNHSLPTGRASRDLARAQSAQRFMSTRQLLWHLSTAALTGPENTCQLSLSANCMSWMPWHWPIRSRRKTRRGVRAIAGPRPEAEPWSVALTGFRVQASSLKGRLVAFTTPEPYAKVLERHLLAAGAETLWSPTVATELTEESHREVCEYIWGSVANLNQYSGIAFTSRNGIDAVARALRERVEESWPSEGGEIKDPSSSDCERRPFFLCALGKDAELLGSLDPLLALDRVQRVIPSVATPLAIVEALGEGYGRKILCPVPKVEGLEEPRVVPDFLEALASRGWDPIRVNAYVTRWCGANCAQSLVAHLGIGRPIAQPASLLFKEQDPHDPQSYYRNTKLSIVREVPRNRNMEVNPGNKSMRSNSAKVLEPSTHGEVHGRGLNLRGDEKIARGEQGQLQAKSQIVRSKVDAIVFTSTAEIDGLLRSLRELGVEPLRVLGKGRGGCVTAAHGPVTAMGAAKLGLDVDVVSENFHTFAGVVESLGNTFNV